MSPVPKAHHGGANAGAHVGSPTERSSMPAELPAFQRREMRVSRFADLGAPHGLNRSNTLTMNLRHKDERNAGLAPQSSLEDEVKKVQSVKEFLEDREGSALRAWIRHFDTNHDQKISLNEFIRGMKKLNYTGDITSAFTMLDADLSGELSLEEIDMGQASLWRRFCTWCVREFSSPQDMIDRVSEKTDEGYKATEKSFVEKLQKLGWNEGFASLLFQSLDTEGTGYITTSSLRWLEQEKRRQKKKDAAKARAASDGRRQKAIESEMSEKELVDFTSALKRKYGSLIRAWRCALSPNSLVLQKAELFKSIAAIGFPCDVRLLWQAFDKDDNGTVSIEEFDPKGAEVLAQFHKFIKDTFGTSSAAFRAFDKFNCKKLRLPEFLSAVKENGFHLPAKNLFHGFDMHGHKAIVEEELSFLDKWKPPPFLVASANPSAAEEVKRLLLKTYKNFLKAWRHCLDVDSSNRCSWKEFSAGCQTIGFIGDIPGAWRALDDDLSGYITLSEIDAKAAETLLRFKKWADEEFGSVRSAFGVFDADGSNEVTYREFRRACRAYGLDGDTHTLFYALDAERNGSISQAEVTFLDEWEFRSEGASQTTQGNADMGGEQPRWQGSRKPELTAYETDGPGPAGYTLPSSIGASSRVPMTRHSGAYTFRKRTPKLERLPWLANSDAQYTPAPIAYDSLNSMQLTVRSKPTWTFSSSPREAVQRSQIDHSSPGPGNYTANGFEYSRQSAGPAVMILPRRPLRAHPLFRGEPSPRAPPRVSYTVKR